MHNAAFSGWTKSLVMAYNLLGFNVYWVLMIRPSTLKKKILLAQNFFMINPGERGREEERERESDEEEVEVKNEDSGINGSSGFHCISINFEVPGTLCLGCPFLWKTLYLCLCAFLFFFFFLFLGCF